MRVVEPPLATVVDAAESAIVGAAGRVTETLTDWVTEPPAPVQVSANEEPAVNAPVDAEPDVPRLPLQLPDAEQAVAFVDDHERVADDPEKTVDGSTARLTVGAGDTAGACTTFAVTVWPAVPPGPEQVRA